MYGCSLNPNSKIWTTTTKIAEDKNLKTKYITSKKEILNKELNVGLKIDIKDYLIDKEKQTNLTNNIYSKNELKLKKKVSIIILKLSNLINMNQRFHL